MVEVLLVDDEEPVVEALEGMDRNWLVLGVVLFEIQGELRAGFACENGGAGGSVALGEQQQKCWAKRTRVSALHFSNRKVKQPQQPNDGDVTDAGWRGARGGEEHGAGSLPAALITTTKVFELLFRCVCLQRGEGKET